MRACLAEMILYKFTLKSKFNANSPGIRGVYMIGFWVPKVEN